jgi:hypothetical protein
MQNRENGGGRLLVAIAAMLPLAVIIYVLSFGPVAMALQPVQGGAEVFNTVYWPIIAFDRHWPGTGIAEYQHWWMNEPVTLPNS